MEGTRKFLLVERISEVTNLGGDTKESIRDFILQKLNLLLHFLENTWGILAEKLNQVLPRSFIRQKLNLFLHFLENTWGILAEKLNQVLPPEKRSQWVHVGLTLVLPIALALLCLYYCCKCCCRSWGVAGKMMKAPGRRGAVMPRDSFEGNPKGYFRGLRANKPLVY